MFATTKKYRIFLLKQKDGGAALVETAFSITLVLVVLLSLLMLIASVFLSQALSFVASNALRTASIGQIDIQGANIQVTAFTGGQIVELLNTRLTAMGLDSSSFTIGICLTADAPCISRSPNGGLTGSMVENIARGQEIEVALIRQLSLPIVGTVIPISARASAFIE